MRLARASYAERAAAITAVARLSKLARVPQLIYEQRPDEELLEPPRLVGDGSKGNCVTAAACLIAYLAARGVVAWAVPCRYLGAPHVVVETADGRILDPTRTAFTNLASSGGALVGRRR